MTLADATLVQQGESVFAIGNPGDAMLFSVTKGIVSAVGQRRPADEFPWRSGRHQHAKAGEERRYEYRFGSLGHGFVECMPSFYHAKNISMRTPPQSPTASPNS
jgi:hypothetical protein